jgi:hypothetical protein
MITDAREQGGLSEAEPRGGCDTDGRMTFNALAKREPRLLRLKQDVAYLAAGVLPGDHFCANGPWYRIFKLRLVCLVGFGRDDSKFPGSREAYDLAYHHLYNLLPDCNHEGLMYGG